MGGLQVRLLAWASAAALLSSGAVTAGASALAVGVTVPGVGGVEATLPDAQVPSVTVPSVTVPSVPPLPAPVPPPPSVQTPGVQTPGVPGPSVQTPPAPAVPSGGLQQPGSTGTGAPSGPATADAGGSLGAGSGGSSGAPANDAAAGQGSSGPGGALRVRRDRTAVDGAPADPAGSAVAQRRLESTVEDGRQCLADLGPSERRVLGMRAGLGPGAPLTRPQVAHRLDLGVAQTGRIERRGLRRLHALAGDGMCGGVGSAVATAGPLTATGAFAGANGDATPGADPSDFRPRFGVGGVVAHGRGDSGSDGRTGFGTLPPPIGDGGEATLLVALCLLVALALLVRRELSRR